MLQCSYQVHPFLEVLEFNCEFRLVFGSFFFKFVDLLLLLCQNLFCGGILQQDLLADGFLQLLPVFDAPLQSLQLLLELIDFFLVFIDDLLLLPDLLFEQLVFLLMNKELKFTSLRNRNGGLFEPLLVVLGVQILHGYSSPLLDKLIICYYKLLGLKDINNLLVVEKLLLFLIGILQFQLFGR